MITNTQAVKFCNENCRRLADMLEQFDRTASQFMLNVVRDWEQISEVSQAVDGDVIVDGSVTDGRTTRTKVNVAQLKYVIEQVQAAISTDDRRALVHGWVTNGQPLF